MKGNPRDQNAQNTNSLDKRKSFICKFRNKILILQQLKSQLARQKPKKSQKSHLCFILTILIAKVRPEPLSVEQKLKFANCFLFVQRDTYVALSSMSRIKDKKEQHKITCAALFIRLKIELLTLRFSNSLPSHRGFFALIPHIQ